MQKLTVAIVVVDILVVEETTATKMGGVRVTIVMKRGG